MGEPSQTRPDESNAPPEATGNAGRKHVGDRSDAAAPDLPSRGDSSTPLRMLSVAHLQNRLRPSSDTPTDSEPNPYQSHGGHGRRIVHIRPSWRPWEWRPLERISELATRRLGQASFQGLERIQPYITAPYWRAPEVVIAENAEKAIAEHNTITTHGRPVTTVYTDGSGVV